jgi:hypothetical protein
MRIGIKANGQSLFDEQVAMTKTWSRMFDLSSVPPAKEMVIEILSDTWVPAQAIPGSTDERVFGVCLRYITLISGTRSFVNVPLGVREVPGVEETGFHGPETAGNGPCRWTDGAAKLIVPLAGRTPKALAVAMDVPDRLLYRVQISVGGQKIFDGIRPPGQWSAVLPLNGAKLPDPAVIEITSPIVIPAEGKSGNKDNRKLGIRVFRLMLVDDAAPETMPSASDVR